MERKKLLAIVISLSVILSVPLVLSSGLVDVSQFSPGSSPAPMSSSSTASVFMDPAMNVTDYEDPIHDVSIGSTVTFHINISDVTDLYTWHVKISWDNTLLNASEMIYGDFLAGTTSPNGTSAAIANITGIFNEDGYGWAAESVLTEYPGVSDNGTFTLLEIDFLIVGYGHTNLNVNVTGSMPTELLDSTGSNMTFTTVDGYFRNTLTGDIQGDTGGTLPDGDVDRYDFFAFAGNYGRSVVLP